MKDYNIRYEILNYDKLENRLKTIVNNKANQFKVFKHVPIGESSCGFPINHYSIGEGFIHVLYIGGCHGNEIISVDFVTQLMENLALGTKSFATFDPSIYTIDFIPCLNPEGFYTTTYALDTKIKNLNEQELENFCRDYYLKYRHDDTLVLNINRFLKEYSVTNNFDSSKIIQDFWHQYRHQKLITYQELEAFLPPKTNFDLLWKKYFKANQIDLTKQHQELFKDLSLDIIPNRDYAHRLLKNKLSKLYAQNNLPFYSLANFYANADGVNLNDNNPYYYEELKKLKQTQGTVYDNFHENNLRKDIPGSLGTPNYDLEKPFIYAKENLALLNFLNQQQEKHLNYASINCHGTGGLLYFYPVTDKDDNNTRNFSFLINNILATAYTKTTGLVYQNKTKSSDAINNLAYKTMPHPSRITGFGDVLRKNYNAAFLLELSKMGGNPLAPYGDYLGNYTLTMQANFEAFNTLLKTIKKIDYLYDYQYSVIKENNTVSYKLTPHI